MTEQQREHVPWRRHEPGEESTPTTVMPPAAPSAAEARRRSAPSRGAAADRTQRRRWDWGPVVAVTGVVLGVGWLVVGLVLLARAGIPTDLDALDVVAAVGPYAGNAITAGCAILVGLSFLTVGIQRYPTNLFGIGLTAVIVGLVWMIEPAAFGDLLGTNRQTATTALATGGLAALVGGVASERLFRPAKR